MNERNKRIVKIGVMKTHIQDLARWYFLAILMTPRTIIPKDVRKKAIVPKSEAGVACLVSGSVVLTINSANAIMSTREMIFPHFNMKDLFGMTREAADF
ncbi:hypothetical protein EPO33_00120 [Patescibacteria group bacterium]|nr:MAG: hypothetical protein EPO33_00120 [Patescibacteria group bacterium]